MKELKSLVVSLTFLLLDKLKHILTTVYSKYFIMYNECIKYQQEEKEINK